MAKCDEGYICSVCKEDVGKITESDLYLRFVTGSVDPETLHTQKEHHIRCNPILAQFIVDDKFDPIVVEGGDFDKRVMDAEYVSERESLITRGWHRLKEVESIERITEYLLPEFQDKWQ